MLSDDKGIRRWIEGREFKCPGCGLDDNWAFERSSVVVTLPKESFDSGVGSLRMNSDSAENVEKAMQEAIEDLQEASRSTSNQVVKLPCGTCGYVLFLDGKQLL